MDTRQEAVNIRALTGVIAGVGLIGFGVSFHIVGLEPEMVGFLNSFGLALFCGAVAYHIDATIGERAIPFPAIVNGIIAVICLALAAGYGIPEMIEELKKLVA